MGVGDGGMSASEDKDPLWRLVSTHPRFSHIVEEPTKADSA